MTNLLKKENNSSNTIGKMLVIALFLCVVKVYTFPNFMPSVFGLLIAMLLSLNSFTKYYYFTPIIILFGNNDLGDVFFGKFKFIMVGIVLSLTFFCMSKFNDFKFNKSALLSFAVLMLMAIHYFIVEKINKGTDSIITTVIPLIMIFVLINREKTKKADYEKIAFAIGLITFISAFQSVFFGGVPYIVINTSEGKMVRYGVLGAGVGDPNYSGFYILFGIICLFFYCKRLKWYLKIPMIVIMVFAIFRTASSSSIGTLIIVLLVSVILSKKIKLRYKLMILIIFVSLFVLLIVFSLSSSNTIFALNRFANKILQIISGDFSDATTGRFDLLGNYIEYFINQPLLKFIFGGNQINISSIEYAGYDLVSHNTYMDMFLRFGFIGGTLFIGSVIYQFVNAVKIKLKTNDDSNFIYLKLATMIFIFTVSMNIGELYCISMLNLFFLNYYEKPQNNEEKDLKGSVVNAD